jgi:hypothetical protein
MAKESLCELEMRNKKNKTAYRSCETNGMPMELFNKEHFFCDGKYLAAVLHRHRFDAVNVEACG